ncbi:MAG TPA: UDP-N-acetylmuramoyl-tripeptide--D-alanyl-D-alanine ligase, partial [Usitatibacteraceae bacterium]|nr:UDP-N-acetylmuramoyl-tripeptide--D-alanyl-D-alanine ligase [Usitatibacteraceae bacterium]
MNAPFRLSLDEVAEACGGRRVGSGTVVAGVSSDSRSVAPGELFVALRGDKFDAHDFLPAAIGRGAAAALVARELPGLAVPQVVVADTRLALGRIASHWRARFAAPMLALTGSNGKTTVKEMLREILAAHTGDAASVHVTAGNLNNEIGVPLTLLAQRAQHRYAVIEMGMNHLGEIAYLVRMANPDVALVIMAGTAHIGELGSREAIARAKGE